MRKYILIPFKQYQDSQRNKSLHLEQDSTTLSTPQTAAEQIEKSKTVEPSETSIPTLPGSEILPINPKIKGVSTAAKKQRIHARKRKRSRTPADLQPRSGESQPELSPPLRKSGKHNVANASSPNTSVGGSRKFWLSI